jgi:hypothetical protein
VNEIWLGDLARCLDALRPSDDASVRAITRALGLGIEAPHEPPPQPIRRDLPSHELQDEQRVYAVPTQPPSPVDLEPLPLLREVERPDEDAGLLWAAVEPLESEPPAGARRPPRHEPLLEPGWTRELIASALATMAYDGPVDGVRLVDTLARGAPIDEVPRRPRATLTLGVQLLVDVSDAMDPFVRDRHELIADVMNVVGASRVSTRFFREAPARGITAGPSSPSSAFYIPPEHGVPVLALTDLGIAGARASYLPGSESEWIGLRNLLRSRGSPLIVLVPYSPPRWPRKLASELTIVQWDRSTTASRLHARVARGSG